MSRMGDEGFKSWFNACLSVTIKLVQMAVVHLGHSNTALDFGLFLSFCA